jgi:hypothetical protein
VLTAVAGIPSTEILTSIAGAGPNNCGVPELKFHLLSPSYGSPAGILAELQTLTMFVAPPNGTTSVVGYAVLRRQRSFLYGLVTMMF